jgi:hypothetical protein
MPKGKHAKSTNKPKRPAPMIVLRAMCLDGILQLLFRDIQSVTQDLLQHSMEGLRKAWRLLKEDLL